jgi:uncharacterized protein (TIGR02996 family)
MTDEDAFLAKIRENPADDTARLVYADWLDEHGQPEKAEFLRLEHQLRSARERIAVLGERLDPAWVQLVLGRASITLRGYPPDRKIAVIRLIRELTGYGLAEAKNLSESLPAVIRREVDVTTAAEIKRRFEEIGTQVSTLPAIRLDRGMA